MDTYGTYDTSIYKYCEELSSFCSCSNLLNRPLSKCLDRLVDNGGIAIVLRLKVEPVAAGAVVW